MCSSWERIIELSDPLHTWKGDWGPEVVAVAKKLTKLQNLLKVQQGLKFSLVKNKELEAC